MTIQINTNIADVARAMSQTAANVEPAAAKATRAATQVVFNEDRKQVNAIYARAIPVSKRGRARWKRKGTLRRGEAMSFPSPLQGMIGNDTPYAQRRHELNRPGADGVTRHDPWRRKTVDAAQGKAVATFEQVFTEALTK